MGKKGYYLVVPLVLMLACMPLATPMLTEESGPPQGIFSPSAGDSPEPPAPAITPESPGPTVTPELPPPPSTPGMPVTLVLAGNEFNRGSLDLLGGYRDGYWLGVEGAVDFVDINAEYRAFLLDGLEQTVHIDSVQWQDDPGGHCSQPAYNLQVQENVPPRSVGLNAGWPAFPRPVEWLSNKNDFYIQAVEDYLRSAGLDRPDVNIQQVLRADLDGDGADEVLIAAARFIEPTGHSTAPGDYSLVLLRKVVGGQVVTQRVIGEVYTSDEPLAFPPTYSIQGILDVNANGRLELLVYQHIWEGHGTILFELRDNSLEEALRQVCGL